LAATLRLGASPEVGHAGDHPWLCARDLGGGAQASLPDCLGAIDTLERRRNQLERTISELVPGSPHAQTVARLRWLRGIDTLSAVALVAEIGDFERFPRAGQLMSHLGRVPSENSSGEIRRQGAITKTGPWHARRLLVKAVWHYRKNPARGLMLQRGQDGQSADVITISWPAQRRLHHLWRRLADHRGKRRAIVPVAVARELAGFCWALARAD
jgi:transposase